MACGVQRHLEDLLVDPDRRARVAELLVAELRLLEEELLALLIGLGGLGPPLDHVEQRGVVARLLVERFEGHERAPIVAAELESLRVVLLRERRLSEGRARDLGDPERDLELQIPVDDVADRRAQELHELRVLAGRRGEPLDALDPLPELRIRIPPRGAREPHTTSARAGSPRGPSATFTACAMVASFAVIESACSASISRTRRSFSWRPSAS